MIDIPGDAPFKEVHDDDADPDQRKSAHYYDSRVVHDNALSDSDRDGDGRRNWADHRARASAASSSDGHASNPFGSARRAAPSGTPSILAPMDAEATATSTDDAPTAGDAAGAAAAAIASEAATGPAVAAGGAGDEAMPDAAGDGDGQ